MDRKTILILAASVALLCVLFPAVDHFFPPQVVEVTNAPPSMSNGVAQLAPALGTNVASSTATPAANLSTTATTSVQPAAPEQMLVVSNRDSVFSFTSREGGIKSIALKGFRAVVSPTRKIQDDDNNATLNATAPAPVLALLGDLAQANDDYTLTQSSNTVRAEKTFANGLHVIKVFDFGNGTNFLFTASLRLENTSAAPLQIPRREVVSGTATPIGPLDDPTTLGLIWYNGVKATDIGASRFANRALGCVPGTGTPLTEVEDGASNVVWTATHNQYFALAAIPAQPAPGFVVRNVSLPVPDTNEVASAPRAMLLTNGFQAAFVYPAVTLDPHKTWDQSFTFYAGPKEYNGLARIGQYMGNNLDLVMGFTGFLGFGFFSKLLLLSMNGIHALGLPYGLCIIFVAVVLKLIFWPMTAASTRSQKRLQLLQPQLKAIADKYKDEPLKKHEKTTEFMKEHKINPMGSCLPMLIQIPVFIGFYSMLRSAIELRGVPFLWAPDLSLPDTVATIGGFPINPLPLIMGATQLWQAQLTPPSPGMDPGQQKLMRYMPILFIAMFYRMSAGLIIYWTVSNLLTVAQTKMTKTVDEPGTPVASAPRKKK